MSINVSLRAVTADNFDQLTKLPLLDHQVDFLDSNAYSIAEASFYPHYHTRAIYDGEQAVGFLMFVSLAEEGDPGEYSIYRFMVDHRRQGLGLGRRALALLLDEIKALPGAAGVWICYSPVNPTARAFYASAGFVETELDENGEMWAYIAFGTAALVS